MKKVAILTRRYGENFWSIFSDTCIHDFPEMFGNKDIGLMIYVTDRDGHNLSCQIDLMKF